MLALYLTFPRRAGLGPDGTLQQDQTFDPSARAAGTIIAARFNALAVEPYRLRGDLKARNETADDASMTVVSPASYW
jgi:hypothetical protein